LRCQAMGADHSPPVGVVTVVKNGGSSIEKCIQSVLNQTYANVEHVIIDGGSSDSTCEILHAYSPKIAYWHSRSDLGIYNALNTGLRHLNASMYVPLSSDDELCVDGIETLLNSLSGRLAVMAKVKYPNIALGSFKAIRNHSAGCLITMKAHELIGFYDESYKIAADTKFLQQVKLYSGISLADDIVGIFNPGGVSSSYRGCIAEHARAMVESRAWHKTFAYMWLAPRLIYAKTLKSPRAEW
jgi:glycosyltransferase involved in cell wall biosynthesis